LSAGAAERAAVQAEAAKAEKGALTTAAAAALSAEAAERAAVQAEAAKAEKMVASPSATAAHAEKMEASAQVC
jgi:hypothetical protein